MEKAARWTNDVDKSKFEEICKDLNQEVHLLQWTFEELNDDPFTSVKKLLTGTARKAYIAASHGFLDAYRKLITELDPVNARTKAVMMDSITGMIGRGRAKTEKETKSKLLDLQVLVNKHPKRISELPDDILLASVSSNILDDKTKNMFTNAGILDNSKGMSLRINAIAVESDTYIDRMDIGNVEDNGGERQAPKMSSSPSAALTPMSPPTPPGAQQGPHAETSAMTAQGGKGQNPNILCFTCNQIGHPSFRCPLKDASKGGKGSKNYWQMMPWSPNPKGCMDMGKGKSKGNSSWNGKGGKGTYAVDEWGGHGEEDWWVGSNFCLMCNEENAEERPSLESVVKLDPVTNALPEQFHKDKAAQRALVQGVMSGSSKSWESMKTHKCNRCGVTQVNCGDNLVQCCELEDNVVKEEIMVIPWNVMVKSGKPNKVSTNMTISEEEAEGHESQCH